MPENSPAAVFAGIRYGEVIEEAIRDQVALGRDGIEWDFSPIIIPAHNGSPPMVAYLLIISCRSLLLTAPRVAVCDIVKDSSPTNPKLHAVVATTLEQLYSARAEIARGPGGIGAN